MKFFKMIILAIFTTMLFIGCEKDIAPKVDNSKKMTVTSIEEKKEEKNYHYSMEIPQIINAESEDINYFNMTMKEDARSIIDSMSGSGEEGEYEGGWISYQVHPNSFDVLSITVVTGVHYTGAAHPLHSIDAYVISNRSKKLLTKNDIFTEDDMEYFNMLINDKIRENKEVYNYMGDKVMLFNDAVADIGNAAVYFEGDDIVFLFAIYDISPYSSGNPVFKFNKSKVKKHIHIED